jgi:hypothetical protein
MMMEHLPVATVAVHVSPAPSLIVTLPVGVPLPGASGATVKLTVTGCPATDGLGVFALIFVVVLALFTVCATLADVPELKFVSLL